MEISWILDKQSLAFGSIMSIKIENQIKIATKKNISNYRAIRNTTRISTNEMYLCGVVVNIIFETSYNFIISE